MTCTCVAVPVQFANQSPAVMSDARQEAPPLTDPRVEYVEMNEPSADVQKSATRNSEFIKAEMPTPIRAALGCCFGLFTLVFVTTVSTHWLLLEEHFFELTSAVVLSCVGICVGSLGPLRIRISIPVVLIVYIAFHFFLFATFCMVYYRFDFVAS